jgi:hypothetical protein
MAKKLKRSYGILSPWLEYRPIDVGSVGGNIWSYM